MTPTGTHFDRKWKIYPALDSRKVRFQVSRVAHKGGPTPFLDHFFYRAPQVDINKRSACFLRILRCLDDIFRRLAK